MTADAVATTEAYLDLCRRDSGLRDVAASLPMPVELRDSLVDRVFARPLFVDEHEVRRFAADVDAVFDLIVSLPERLFGGDMIEFCDALRLPPALVPACVRAYGRERPPRYGRADMYHDGKGFRLLEFNIDSEIGGVDKAGELPRLFAAQPAFREFAAGRELRFTQPAEQFAAALRAAAEPLTGGEPVVVLAQFTRPGGDDDATYASRRSLASVMCRLGLDFRVDALSEVVEKDGRLHHRGVPVDVVVRGFSAYDVVSRPDGRRLTEPLFRVAEQSGVVLWTDLSSQLFANKACFAMLSDPRHCTNFSAEELAVIDRVVPWTRAVDPDFDLADAPWLLDKDDLVLKPNYFYGGIGVVAGWEHDERTWLTALRAGAARGAVVQRRIVPRAEPAAGPDGVEDWHAAWGIFLAPQGYSGIYARLLPANTAAVIGVHADRRTRVAGVFAV
jgi:hypothetical protein